MQHLAASPEMLQIPNLHQQKRGHIIMAVMDEFKEERERMKSQPFKVRLDYFWHYYKWHVIITAFVLFFVGDYAYNIITAKDIVLQVGMVDCYTNNDDTADADAYRLALETHLGIDQKKQEIFLDNNYFLTLESDTTSTEIFYVKMAAKELDIIMATEPNFNNTSKNEVFVDLREIMSPEQLERYKDSFYYLDYATLEDAYSTDITMQPAIDMTDHRSPEGMEQPVPVGVYIKTNQAFRDEYIFANAKEQEVVFGVAFYAEYPEYALQFLDYISEAE